MLPKTTGHIRRLATVKAATTLTLQDVDTGSHHTKEKGRVSPALQLLAPRAGFEPAT